MLLRHPQLDLELLVHDGAIMSVDTLLRQPQADRDVDNVHTKLPSCSPVSSMARPQRVRRPQDCVQQDTRRSNKHHAVNASWKMETPVACKTYLNSCLITANSYLLHADRVSDVSNSSINA